MPHTHRAAQSFVKYLDRNPVPGDLELNIEKIEDYIFLVYHTIDPDYSRSFMSEFPRARYRGEAAKQLLWLLEDTDPEFKLKGSSYGRTRLLLFPDELDKLHENVTRECEGLHLKKKLQLLRGPAYDTAPVATGETVASPAQQEVITSPHQLLQWSTHVTTYLNKDIASELELALEGISRRLSHDMPRDRKSLMASISKYYVCDDDVELPIVTESHFRPFTLAGFWIGLSPLPYAPLSVGIAMHDTRRPGSIQQLGIQKRFTDEVCFFYGLENLQLAPAMRPWVEQYGQPHPSQKGIWLLSLADFTQLPDL